MLTVYGIPNCDTVKKAVTALKEHQLPYTFHDYKKQGITPEKLALWLTQYPKETFINRAGTTWKQLSDEQKSAVQDDESAIALMMEKPSVIKRPVIEKEGLIIAVGWKPETLAQL
ncbi:arsenate reductase [Runella slithyformis]|uniref:ArsC family protein n=1 Tax=Runella slithyformis (strain ATCC 29530 / DSM 19594 / LMG 11500 / NCIMB 11436 / LSU 4) TaxID=761193 RepID=A0A7U3ZJZ3_RUNSL|nr:arsenate reductase [Runella slithyformis]AEI48590.1 ArsC family protein [Runella slithyformis DSM 19594]